MAMNSKPSEYVLPLADRQATLETVGGKGASLARLVAAGLPVPDGFHVTTAAYWRFVAENDLRPGILAALEPVDISQSATLEAASTAIRALFAGAQTPPDVASAIALAYAELGGRYPIVAVRSSATAEDLPDASFAGQQETFLNVQGATEVLEAVKRCWASLWTARAIGYRARQGIEHSAVGLAVVVQELVPAEAAGILFTANPLTSRRDQAMISAAWGLGEAIVGGLVTPDTIVADKASGQVKQLEVADKAVMTVLTPEGTAEQPVTTSRRKARVLDDVQVAKLVCLGRQIEALYATPQDIEWCWAQGEFFIVQSRPITTLDETALPQVPPPIEWKLPPGAYIAMRNNIVELMAEPLTPLFSTLGLAAVNASMGRLLSDFFDKSGLMPKEIIITVNEYAYYNGSLSPWQMGQIFLGSVGILKRMFTGAVERWTDVGRPRYVATVERWQARHWRELPTTEILSAGRELSEAAIHAYGALVSGVIPAAWISEALFTVVYNTLIKRRDDPPAPTYLLGFDSTPIIAEKSLYDLAEWARTHDGLAAYLSCTPAAQIAAQRDWTPPGVDEGDWHEWQNRFQAHLQRYGHAIYNLDFANPVPADDPTPLLETFKLFLSGQGVNPHTRQQAAAEQRERATQAILNRLKGLRLKLFCKFIAPARKYAPLREDGLADVGLGYPLLRQMLREVGRRFVEGGMIEKPDDIFWLTQDEVELAASRLDRGEALSRLTTIVPQRKATWRATRRVNAPLVLPQIKFLGVDIGELKKGRGRKGDTLKGVAASRGSVTATARVLHGPEDFDLMRPGDVLVAPITTPAWTPLFAMAAAVVTDVGGPLSHGSIVAREYGIPAVLGTGVATRRIRSGQRITVDGDAGVVTLVETKEVFTDEWNATVRGDYLWTNMIVGEVFPTATTPSTWSVWQDFFSNLSLGNAPTIGNIAGRPYLNYSLMYSFLLKLTRKHERVAGLIKDSIGVPPAGVDIPSFPVSWRTVLFQVLPREFRNEMKKSKLKKAAPEFLAMIRDRCPELRRRVGEAQGDELISLWTDDIKPLWKEMHLLQDKMNEELQGLTRKLKTELTKLLGNDEANALLTTISGAGELASLGPLVGLSRLSSGELSRDEYLQRYGHRGPHENELGEPRPYEDPKWLDMQLAEFAKSPVDVTAMLEKRDAEFDVVRQEITRQLPPKKAQGVAHYIAAIVETNTLREATRSELTRIVDVIRVFFLRASELSGLGDGVFFLTVDELVAVLSGDTSAAAHIPARQQAYKKYRALPPLPAWIRGRFDPFQWAADPNRRRDVFDTHMPLSPPAPNADNVIRGQPGSAGRLEGIVQRIDGPDEGDRLQPGEILVTSTTNVGWTPLFPRAAAVVTDIGGSLSHAAIVARELGIPAVVGCGDATMRLRTGDRVRVDGGRGIVEILEKD